MMQTNNNPPAVDRVVRNSQNMDKGGQHNCGQKNQKGANDEIFSAVDIVTVSPLHHCDTTVADKEKEHAKTCSEDPSQSSPSVIGRRVGSSTYFTGRLLKARNIFMNSSPTRKAVETPSEAPLGRYKSK